MLILVGTFTPNDLPLKTYREIIATTSRSCYDPERNSFSYGVYGPVFYSFGVMGEGCPIVGNYNPRLSEFFNRHADGTMFIAKEVKEAWPYNIVCYTRQFEQFQNTCEQIATQFEIKHEVYCVNADTIRIS
jgi:hypothetical protein